MSQPNPRTVRQETREWMWGHMTQNPQATVEELGHAARVHFNQMYGYVDHPGADPKRFKEIIKVSIEVAPVIVKLWDDRDQSMRAEVRDWGWTWCQAQPRVRCDEFREFGRAHFAARYVNDAVRLVLAEAAVDEFSTLFERLFFEG